MPSSDASTGFFSILRETFDSLAHEEELSCEWEDLAAAPLPSFGDRHDDYETTVKPFYAKWTGFATQKTFSWKDLYKYSDAPDRRTRRLMEKENRRFREEAIREYNDAVRSLVAFVKKRDPRIKLNSESEADRQRVLRDAAAAQAARSRAANQLKTAQLDTLPDWAKSSEPVESLESDEEVYRTAPKAEIECVICNKAFKSEKQYESHEKSKKHIRNVGQIRKEMRHDDVHFDLTRESSGPRSKTPEQGSHQSEGTDALRIRPESLANEPSMADDSDEELVRGVGSVHLFDATEESSQSLESLPTNSKRPSLDDHEGAVGDSRPSRSSSPVPDEGGHGDPGASTERGFGDRPRSPKIGKAKQKRAKKTAQKSSEAGGAVEVACSTCGSNFTSKTKLFHHLNETGHAQPIPDSRQAGKARKRP